QVDERIWRTEEQWQKSTSQSEETTTQYMMERFQFKLGRVQVKMHQYQVTRKPAGQEFYSATDGVCPQLPDDLCKIEELFPIGPASPLVDPSTCTTGPGPTIGGGPTYIRTECTPGPLALPYGP